jgi:Asp-tRNA(Asn)/Glu-tRNA(Gln) amidotransferase A subunit family amidase
MTPEATLRGWQQRLDARELSARELAQHFLERIADAEPLNAVAWLDPDATLAEADRADAARAAGARSPLLGVPLTIKDSLETIGFPTTCGSWARSGDPGTRDATAVARLRAQGAVVLAKSTVPEYLMAGVTESVRHGRTSHPRDVARTPGGSSGGEAALVAAGASPGGLGSDGGASIRLPSHYCGVVGLRPTTGRVPETGHWPATRATGLGDVTCVGPIATSVDDAELLLHAIAGADGIDPFAVPAPLRPSAAVDVPRLRVAFSTADPLAPVTAATTRTVEQAARALAARGCDVEQASPPGTEEATELFFALASADGGARARADLAAAGDRLDPNTVVRLDWRRSHALDAAGYFAVLERVHAFRSRLDSFFDRYDAYLSPVAPGPAPLHGHWPGAEVGNESLDALNWLHVHAVGGTPAVSVPFGAEGGLPLGVQVAARRFREDVVLAVAAELGSG